MRDKVELIGFVIMLMFGIAWLAQPEKSWYEPLIAILGFILVLITYNNRKRITEVKKEVTNKGVPITYEEFEFYLKTFPKAHKGLKIALTFYKNTPFSWIYEEGQQLVETLNKPKIQAKNKIQAIDELLSLLERTFKEELIIEKFKEEWAVKFHFTKSYVILKHYLNRTKQVVEEQNKGGTHSFT